MSSSSSSESCSLEWASSVGMHVVVFRELDEKETECNEILYKDHEKRLAPKTNANAKANTKANKRRKRRPLPHPSLKIPGR